MVRSVRLIVGAILIMLVPLSTASGHINEPWSLTEVVSLSGSETTRTPGDTYQVYAGMTWDSLRRSNMRHAQDHGYRFTHDFQDMSGNLNANDDFVTELPCPYYDKDDDNFNGRWEEAEITVECVSLFPQFNVRYDSYLELMRWWHNSQYWVWDPDGGVMEQNEELSEPGFGDKWNTVPGWYAPIGSWNYGYVGCCAPPSGLTAASTDAPTAINANPGDPMPPPALGEEPFTVDSMQDADDLIVRPDLSGGLDSYAARSRDIARGLVVTGPGRGVITFAAPVQPADLSEFRELGLVIHTVEAISEPNADLLRWTLGTAYGDGLGDEMASAAADLSASWLGIIAAEVTVPDSATYEALESHALVYLVDLSPEQVRRQRGPTTDVGVNDVYWQLAGLDQ